MGFSGDGDGAGHPPKIKALTSATANMAMNSFFISIGSFLDFDYLDYRCLLPHS
jgi:hypothetical protein